MSDDLLVPFALVIPFGLVIPSEARNLLFLCPA